jgi:hypothetical protein
LNGPGYCYVLTHPAWRNIGPAGAVKIGRTGRDPRIRLAEITALSGLCAPGEVAFCMWVEDMQAVEKAIQQDLGRFRIRRRELFRVDVDTARRAIETAACGKVLPVPMTLRRPARRSQPRPTGLPRNMPRVALRCLLAALTGIALLLAWLAR